MCGAYMVCHAVMFFNLICSRHQWTKTMLPAKTKALIQEAIARIFQSILITYGETRNNQ